MIHLVFGLPWFYVVARTIWPLPWPDLIKVAASLILLIASQFHLWSRLSSGSIFNPEFPRPLILIFNWLLGSIVLMMAGQVIIDLGALLGFAAETKLGGVSTDLRYAFGAVALVLSAFGVLQASRTPPLREVMIYIADLPARFEGYTIVQLTDLHISRLFTSSWAGAVVDDVNRLEPDLILVTGDVIDGSVARRRDDVEPLRRLRAADGIFFIAGNHEYLSGFDSWMEYLSSLGMHGLANAHAIVSRHGEQLVIAGVTDRSARGANRELPDLEKALSGAPTGAPIILLDHEPGMAKRAAARGVAVQLSGHTHGGMIVGLDRLVAQANGGYVSGLYTIGSMTLYVNNGTGIWPGFAIRLGRPSELTRISLRRALSVGATA
jgi:predicted MPP superfamily phosphohydrolase